MNILLLGSGGREHALSWKLKQSPLCEKLYIAPGNAGTSECGVNIPMRIDGDFEAMEQFCRFNEGLVRVRVSQIYSWSFLQ